MRKIKLFGLSLILGLILQSSFAFGQGDIGVVGLMSGRITKAEGRGVGGVAVSVIPIGWCFNWQGNLTRTNPFGYYRLLVHYDCVLFVRTTRKGMTFSPSSMIIPLDSTYNDVDFVAN